MFQNGTGALVRKSQLKQRGDNSVVLDATVVTEGKARQVVDEATGEKRFEREKVHTRLVAWDDNARRLDKMNIGESFDFSGAWHQPAPYEKDGVTIRPDKVVDLDRVEYNRRDGRFQGKTAEAGVDQDTSQQEQDAAEVGASL